VTVPAIATATNGAMLIGGVGADGSTASMNQPAGWTEPWESTGGKMAEQAYALQPTAGSTGSQTWTLTSGRAVAGWFTALRPASS
jgi:hypothetical protein